MLIELLLYIYIKTKKTDYLPLLEAWGRNRFSTKLRLLYVVRPAYNIRYLYAQVSCYHTIYVYSVDFRMRYNTVEYITWQRYIIKI